MAAKGKKGFGEWSVFRGGWFGREPIEAIKDTVFKCYIGKMGVAPAFG
ncbi:MAG TPA: hypothetical protein PLJ69_00280 [Methanothrix sp.]|nr:hypothetical protein [Methanothrix sp.]HOI69800.1 hypothetical protein [Methanothrix sp.]HPY71697.1 hypothetical protein [Methanothrix sp.]HQA61364.1 hypothetical protein [Methanothrix sp.]